MERKPFLKEVAGLYRDEISTDSKSLCFVFPNRRASVFFRQYISELVDRPVFSPQLVTMNELFGEMSGFRVPDRVELLKVLYDSYVGVTGRTSESFDEFVWWGDMLLADFNDVDKYLADPEQLFVNVADLNALQDDFSYMSPEQREALTAFWGSYFRGGRAHEESARGRFKSNWDSLLGLYRDFNARLAADGAAYEGMVYRSVAMSLDGTEDPLPRFRRVVFVGLNALNACEKKLLSVLRDSGKGDFYWDFEGPMLTDPANRASFFMADNVRRYPSRYRLAQEAPSVPYVEAVSVPSAAGQAKYAGEVIASLAHAYGGDWRRTAVVLPDPSLLEPLLNAVPECVDSVNVTMGCPLKSSALASLMQSVTMLQLKARRGRDGAAFYNKSVMEILRHSFMVPLEDSRRAAQEIFRQKQIYVREEFFRGMPLLETIFRCAVSDADSDSAEQVYALASYQLEVLSALGRRLPGLEREFVMGYHSAVMKLRDMHLQVRPATYFRLVDAMVSGITVPYRGEPLGGLQVMGPLETRALDFENVIITSVNEGIFPSRNVGSSFIPYTLRKGFGLPTYEYQDAVWAYYFYRLLTRARRVFLISDTRVDGVRGDGESRYVRQIEYLYGDRVEFVRKDVFYGISLSAADGPKAVEKTPELMGMMERIFLEEKKPFSATLLNTYLDCPLSFYFQKLSGIVPEEELEESLDYGSFGTVYHRTMQNLYARFVGRTARREDLEAMRKDRGGIAAEVARVMAEETGSARLRGQNIINREVIVRMVDKTLEVDAQMAPFDVLGLELPLAAEMEFAPGRRARIFGSVDRADVRGGMLRIVDYKTGKVDLDFASVSDIFDRQAASRPHIVLQLFIYQWLVRNSRQAPQTSAGGSVNVIYSVKEIFSGLPAEFAFSDGDYEGMQQETAALLREIFDPSVPFAKGAAAKCEYCDFRPVCSGR